MAYKRTRTAFSVESRKCEDFQVGEAENAMPASLVEQSADPVRRLPRRPNAAHCCGAGSGTLSSPCSEPLPSILIRDTVILTSALRSGHGRNAIAKSLGHKCRVAALPSRVLLIKTFARDNAQPNHRRRQYRYMGLPRGLLHRLALRNGRSLCHLRAYLGPLARAASSRHFPSFGIPQKLFPY